MKKLFIFLMLGLFLISFASAVQFNNYKIYNEESRTVTIKESYLGDVIANVTLNTPLNYQVGYGSEQKVFEFEIENYGGLEYKDIFDKWEFFNTKDMKETWRDIELKYKVFAVENVTEYGCREYEYNESLDMDFCIEEYIKGYHMEDREIWYKLNPSDIKKGQKLIIGGFTYVNKEDSIEWIPTMFGVEVDEWAVWSASLEVDIISAWKLDEPSGTLFDYYGLNNGTNSGATLGVTGKIVNASEFTGGGGNAHINLGSNSSLDNIELFSTSFWVYLDNYGEGTSGRVIQKADNNDGLVMYIDDASSGQLAFIQTWSGGSGVWKTAGGFPTGRWIQVGISYNKSSIANAPQIYVNGTNYSLESSSFPTGTVYNDSAVDMWLGARNTAGVPSREFDGKIDEVMIWDRILSPAEFSDLWNNSNGLTPVPLSTGGTLTTTLISPANATNQSSQLPDLTSTVVVSGGNIEVDNVTYWFDDAAESTNSSGDNGTYIFTPTLTDGAWHTWKVVAWGNDSVQYNSSATNYIAFWNNATLTLPLNSPANATNQSSSTPTVNWSVAISDGYIELDNTTLWLDDVAVATNTSGDSGIYLDDLTLTDGDWHIWRVSGYDNRSKLWNSTEERYIAFWNNVSTIAVTLNDPADDGTFSIPQVFNATAISNRDLVNSSWYSNSTGVWKLNETTTDLGYKVLENNDLSWSQETETTYRGFLIKIGSEDITLNGVVRGSSPSPILRARLSHLNGSFINSTTILSGEMFVFQEIALGANQYYRIEGNGDGGSFTALKNNSVSLLPIDSTDFEWVNGSTTLSNSTDFWNFQSINYTKSDIYRSLFTKTLDSTLIWNVEFCNTNNDCNQSIANFTANLDVGVPFLNVTSPVGVLALGEVGKNFTLNWNVSDASLEPNCIYSYAGANNSVACALNTTPVLVQNVAQEVTMYANDSANNLVLNSTSWIYKVLLVNNTFDPAVLGASTQDFNSSILLGNGTGLDVANLWYNGTNHSAAVVSSGDEYNMFVEFTVPNPATTTSYELFWSFDLNDSSNVNTTVENQTISTTQIDNCSLGTEVIFNMTMYDEEDLDFLNGVTENTSIEVDFEAFSLAGNSVLNFSDTYLQVNPAQICLFGALGTNEFTYDITIRYESEDRQGEFFNVQKGILDNSTAPVQISLYDLITADATKFLITYKDANFLPVADALVLIQRRYVGEGQFRTVEAPATDQQGQATASFDTESVNYAISITKEGVLLATFTNLAVICENPLTEECTINLNSFASGTDFADWNSLGGVTWTKSINETLRRINVDFVSTTGSPIDALLNITYLINNTQICADTLTSSAGTVSCTVGTAYDNQTMMAQFYVGEVRITTFTVIFIRDAFDFLGEDGYLFVFVLLITLPLIMISSTIGIIIGSMVGMIAASLLLLINTGGMIGTGSIITWVIITGGIIIYKIASRETK